MKPGVLSHVCCVMLCHAMLCTDRMRHTRDPGFDGHLCVFVSACVFVSVCVRVCVRVRVCTWMAFWMVCLGVGLCVCASLCFLNGEVCFRACLCFLNGVCMCLVVHFEW